jgi:hypothetical protein
MQLPGSGRGRLNPEMPLTIRTAYAEEGEAAPYRDAIGTDGLLRSCYR